MTRYFLKRLLFGTICLIGVTIIIFVAVRITGDAALLLLPEDATEKDYRELRAELGLDKPIPVQYWIFINGALKGDFGKSTRRRLPAMELVLERVPATLKLGLVAFFWATTAGLLIGMMSATMRGAWTEIFARVVVVSGQSMPTFWVGIMLILIVSVKLGLLPTSGRGTIQHYILPALTLGWFTMAATARVMRSSMLNILNSEYIKLARLKGNPEWKVFWKHGFKNAAIPVLTLAGIQLTHMVGHTVIIETVFSWPGVGKLIIESIYARDYSVVQAGIFLVSAAYIVINLGVDLLYGLLDPRIRYD